MTKAKTQSTAQTDRLLEKGAARALVMRDIAKINSKRRNLVELDSDGTGYRVLGAGEDREWHNELYGFGRFSYYQACLKRYPKMRVIRTFGAYPWGRVQGIAQALARAHRLELEWKAACGDLLAAQKLGLVSVAQTKAIVSKSWRSAPSQGIPFYGHGAFLISLQGPTRKEMGNKIEAAVRHDTAGEAVRRARR